MDCLGSLGGEQRGGCSLVGFVGKLASNFNKGLFAGFERFDDVGVEVLAGAVEDDCAGDLVTVSLFVCALRT